MNELWNTKAYRLLFSAGLLSEFGTFVSEVAIFMRIFELAHGNIEFLGITQCIFLLCMILGTLLGGVFGERDAKVKILLACELFRIPIVLAMLFCSSSLWILIFGNGLVALFSGMFNPTRQALLNEILPPQLLAKANGFFSSSFAFLHAAGPLVGGCLYSMWGQLSPIFYFDLATYVGGIYLLLSLYQLRTKKTDSNPKASDFWIDLQGGLNLMKSHPDFLWIIIRCVVASLALGVVIPLILPMSSEILKLPSYGYGLLLGTFGFGGALGGLFFSRSIHFLSIERLIRILLLGECFSLLAWSSSSIPAWSFVLAFLYGALLFGRIGAQLNFISLRIPKAFNARANSMLDLAMVIPNVLGSLLLVIWGSHMDTQIFLRSTAILFIAFSALLYLLEPKKT